MLWKDFCHHQLSVSSVVSGSSNVVELTSLFFLLNLLIRFCSRHNLTGRRPECTRLASQIGWNSFCSTNERMIELDNLSNLHYAEPTGLKKIIYSTAIRLVNNVLCCCIYLLPLNVCLIIVTAGCVTNCPLGIIKIPWSLNQWKASVNK